MITPVSNSWYMNQLKFAKRDPAEIPVNIEEMAKAIGMPISIIRASLKDDTPLPGCSTKLIGYHLQSKVYFTAGHVQAIAGEVRKVKGSR